jgi:pimeloyl-ACP methyl ester carboxylesterase
VTVSAVTAQNIRVDIAARLGEPAHLAGTVFSPTTSDAQAPVLVALPGGTYSRGYFDLDVPGYSFARDAAARGFTVVTFDHLGTGDSTRPERDIDMSEQGRALAAAIAELPGIIGRDGPYLAVGHSMGGYVAMLQQAEHRTYSALAILGTTNQYVAPLGLPPEMIEAAATAEGRAAMVEQMRSAIPELYIDGDRTPLISWFHLSDVPAAVIERDTETTLTVVPRGCGAAGSVPGITADAAALVEVPVFLAYGEVDVSPAPHAEPAAFARSNDVTLYVLAGSGHCHNMAGTRHVLWDRLARWCAEISG